MGGESQGETGQPGRVRVMERDTHTHTHTHTHTGRGVQDRDGKRETHRDTEIPGEDTGRQR